jgi:hypothetical protein
MQYLKYNIVTVTVHRYSTVLLRGRPGCGLLSAASDGSSHSSYVMNSFTSGHGEHLWAFVAVTAPIMVGKLSRNPETLEQPWSYVRGLACYLHAFTFYVRYLVLVF